MSHHTHRHRRLTVGLLTAVLALPLSLCCMATAGAAETRFTIVDSSPTSWVARGYDNYTVTPADGWTFAASRNFDNGVGFNITGPPLPGTVVDRWFLNFAAPFDALITPGHYPDFQRWPFQAPDRPGLEFGSTGRLDNMASGFFDVFEATYGPTGTVLAFAANFTHYGETNPNNYAIVEVRYNATVPEPAGAGAASLGVLTMLALRRRGATYDAHRPSPEDQQLPEH